MVNILLAFDEQDAVMGSFNQGCIEYYEEYFTVNKIDVTYIKSAQLNDINVQMRTAPLKSFIFAAYSHGSEDGELHSTTGIYLSTAINQQEFRNSFVYTVSCHSGDKLGKSLIENGCQSFIGYRSFFNFWVGYKSFSDCANYGLALFMEKKNTKLIYNKMIEEYNRHIDDIYQSNYVVASLLMENRNALIHLGNDITLDDLAVES